MWCGANSRETKMPLQARYAKGSEIIFQELFKVHFFLCNMQFEDLEPQVDPLLQPHRLSHGPCIPAISFGQLSHTFAGAIISPAWNSLSLLLSCLPKELTLKLKSPGEHPSPPCGRLPSLCPVQGRPSFSLPVHPQHCQCHL